MLNSEHNYIPQRYGQTDRQTTCSSNTSLCIASRGVAHRYYISVSNRIYPVVTARCYAERGIATASRLSVRLSVTLRYRDHIWLEFFENDFTVRAKCGIRFPQTGLSSVLRPRQHRP